MRPRAPAQWSECSSLAYVLPHAIHNEVNETDEPSFAIIVRSENGGRVLQARFDPDRRTVWQGRGLAASVEGTPTSRPTGPPPLSR